MTVNFHIHEVTIISLIIHNPEMPISSFEQLSFMVILFGKRSDDEQLTF